MNPSKLIPLLKWAIPHKFNILITGKPAIGKTDCVFKSLLELGGGDKVENLGNGIYSAGDYDLILSHPAVSDPTDYKGLPFPSKDGTEAVFLPYGNLNLLIKANKPTVFFLDDLGQSSAAVQSAVMQLLLSRSIDGHKVSDHVSFVAATNRREDKANVQGLLEPVKSRFHTIVQLDVTVDDWKKWAIANNMPTDLISFINYRPELIDKFEPSKDLVNSPSPRTIAHVGKMQNAGLDKAIEFEAIKGAAGEGFASEYIPFLKIYRDLPPIEEIIKNPKEAKVSTDPGVLYALTGALGAAMTKQNSRNIITYLSRLSDEIQVATFKDVSSRNDDFDDFPGYADWAVKHADLIL